MRPSELIARYIRGQVAIAGVTQAQLAEALGLANQQAVSRRLKGETPFSIDELIAALRLLDIEYGEVLDEIQRMAAREAARNRTKDVDREKMFGVDLVVDEEVLEVEDGQQGAPGPVPAVRPQSKTRRPR